MKTSVIHEFLESGVNSGDIYTITFVLTIATEPRIMSSGYATRQIKQVKKVFSISFFLYILYNIICGYTCKNVKPSKSIDM